MRASLALTLVVAWACASRTAEAAGGTNAWRSMGMYPVAAGAGAGASKNAPLPMVDSDVALAVRGAFVDATVTQTFVNRTGRPTEATYVFPLPADAVVTGMTIEVDGRRIVAKIEERAAAQARYEEAVRAGVMAATLEQERADVFTQTVAAVPANGTVKITLRFDALARYAANEWSFVLPMVVAPRFVPGVATGGGSTGSGRSPDTDRAPDASRISPGASPGGGGATRVTMTFADAVTSVASSTHEITATKGGHAFTDARTDHDAVVTWTWARPVAGWMERAPDGTAFAAVIVQSEEGRPRRAVVKAVLVVDHAATMKGDASAVAQPFTRALLLKAMGANDRVRIGSTWERPAEAARSLELATKAAQGPFDLTRVLGALRPEGSPVVLVTSGLVADDMAAIEAARRLGVPVHVVGVGPAPARGLLDRLAAVTGGTVRYVLPTDELEVVAASLASTVASGGTALSINWGSLAVREVVPGVTPKLGAGQAMVAVTKLVGTIPATVNVRVRGELVALAPMSSTSVDLTKAGTLARRWAKLRLDDLLVGARDGKAITQLALAYGLVSPYTSLVAVGDRVVVEGGVKHSVPVPVAVPAGMRWDDVRSETSPTTTTAEVDMTSTQHISTPTAPVAPMPTDPAPPKKSVPRAAAVADDGEAEPGAEDESSDVERRYEVQSLASSTTGVMFAPLRVSLFLQGGLVRAADTSSSILGLGARLEKAVGPRALLGGEASLLLVGGDEMRARPLLGARVYVTRFLSIGAGLGAQLGRSLGPAWMGSVRLSLTPHLGAMFRYDGAHLYRDDAETTEGAFTAGLEWTF